MEILDQLKTKLKIKRIALEIVENHLSLDRTVLLGVNDAGYSLATLLRKEIKAISDVSVEMARLRISPATPRKPEPVIEAELKLDGKRIILVDDVANTGRTLFFAFLPLLSHLPKGVEVAVLVDRKHKSFPVQADYVGLTLATTMKETIEVRLDKQSYSVHLH